MRTSDWLRNARGEWFVLAQTALMLAVLVAPKLDGRNAFRSRISGAAGGLLCIGGLGFAVLGSIALGRNLSPFPKPKEKGTLVESGIFSVVRHPIYSGLSLAAFGWSLIWKDCGRGSRRRFFIFRMRSGKTFSKGWGRRIR